MVLQVFLVYLGVVVLPVLFWLWFFYWQDSADPEPKKVLAKVFLAGIFSALLAIGVNQILFDLFRVFVEVSYPEGFKATVDPVQDVVVLVTAFLAGPIEEPIKYLYLRYSVATSRVFRQLADGIVYGATIGIGFAFLENSYYFIQFLQEGGVAVTIGNALMRSFITLLVHVTATGYVGYILARHRLESSCGLRRVYSVLVGVSFYHGIFNLGVGSNLIWPLPFVLAGVFIFFVYLVYLVRKDSSQFIYPSKEAKVYEDM